MEKNETADVRRVRRRQTAAVTGLNAIGNFTLASVIPFNN
jgi:hypothetical protein